MNEKDFELIKPILDMLQAMELTNEQAIILINKIETRIRARR